MSPDILVYCVKMLYFYNVSFLHYCADNFALAGGHTPHKETTVTKWRDNTNTWTNEQTKENHRPVSIQNRKKEMTVYYVVN